MAAVSVGFLALGVGLLVLSVSLGLWVFDLVSLPFAVVASVLGFVRLAVAYAFARTLSRTLVVRTCRRGQYRLSNDSGSSPTNAPIDPS